MRPNTNRALLLAAAALLTMSATPNVQASGFADFVAVDCNRTIVRAEFGGGTSAGEFVRAGDDCPFYNCGIEGLNQPCRCSDPNPPVHCPAPDCEDDVDACGPCTFEDGGDSRYCRAVYCQNHPDAYTCQNEAECESTEFIERDSDGDGVCDRDDTDDDNDGVNDEDDISPNANNPVDNAFSCAVWIAQSGDTRCTGNVV